MTSQSQRSLLLGFIGSITLCGLIGIYCLLVGNMSTLVGKVLASTGVVGAASILGLAAAVPWETRRWYPIGPLGCGAVLVAAILLLCLIWIDRSYQNELFFKSMFVACTLAVALPHIGLLGLARLLRDYEWVRATTVVIIAGLAGLLIVVTVFEQFDSAPLGRFMGALAIADVCGSLAVPILHRVSRIRDRDAVRTTALQLTLTCPRCAASQTLPAGHVQCAECGLRLRIEIEEEHCADCGYVLYGNESGVCPECGSTLDGQARRA